MYGGDDEDRSAEDLTGDRSSDSGVDLTGDFDDVFKGVRIILRSLGDFRGARETAPQHYVSIAEVY